MIKRKSVLILLCITFLAPIVLYTDRISSTLYTPPHHDFLDNVSNLNVDVGAEATNAVHEESSESGEEPNITIFPNSLSNADQILNEPSKKLVQEVPIANHRKHKLRLLSTAAEETQLHERVIQQVVEKDNAICFQSGYQVIKVALFDSISIFLQYIQERRLSVYISCSFPYSWYLNLVGTENDIVKICFINLAFVWLACLFQDTWTLSNFFLIMLYLVMCWSLPPSWICFPRLMPTRLFRCLARISGFLSLFSHLKHETTLTLLWQQQFKHKASSSLFVASPYFRLHQTLACLPYLKCFSLELVH